MQRLERCHQSSGIVCLACSPRPEHTVVAVGCANGEVAFVDWAQGTVLCVLRHHTAEVQCLRWSHLGIEDIETNEEEKDGKEGESQLQMPKSVELLVSAGPGERLKIYETRSIGGGACSTSETDSIEPSPLGEGREIALISTLQLPKPPGNLAQGQRHRLWLSADWLPAPALRRHSNGTIDVWMLSSGYGGGILARRVLLPSCAPFSQDLSNHFGESRLGASGKLVAEIIEEPPVRLPGGHSRTVFSVRCMLDLSREEPGVRIVTIGMDRAAMAWWAPVPRMHRNFLRLEAESEKVPRTRQNADFVKLDWMVNAAYEAEKKSWQRAELVGSITGLGSFPQALSISPRTLQFLQLNSSDSSLPLPQLPKVAVGCGDGSIRILPFQLPFSSQQAQGRLVVENGNDQSDLGIATQKDLPLTTTMMQFDTQASTMIWQGIPAPVTTVLWHPTQENILAFGCSDGSIGLVHSEKGTAILAMTKHKAGISHIAWISSSSSLENETSTENEEESMELENCQEERISEEAGEGAEKKKLEKSRSSHCQLVTLSSDSSLFLWNSWPESSLSELFPTQIKQQQQQGGGAVTLRKELGRPTPLSFPPAAEANRQDSTPTCLGAGCTGVFNVVVGFTDGSVCRIDPAQQHLLHANNIQQQREKNQGGGGAAAVAQVAVYENFYASLHTDKTLQIGDFQKSQMKTPVSVNLAAGGREGGEVELPAVMSMALVVAKESKNNEEDTHSKVYVALGLQDGTIQIWGITNHVDQPEAEKKGEKVENNNDGGGGGGGGGGISLVTVLRGHAGPVVSVEWINVLNSSTTFLENTQVVLFSGSEDQSVRKWDLAVVLKKQREKQEEKLEKQALMGGSVDNNSSSAVGITGEDDVPPPPPPPELNYSKERLEQEEVAEKTKTAPPAAAVKMHASSSSSSSSTTVNKTKAVPTTNTTSTSANVAAHHVSLGSKGLLPPSLPRAETLHDQAPLDAALLSLAAQVASSGGGSSHSVEPPTDYFATLGCVVDPLAAMPALLHASESLLSGPPQRPAAARVLAQRAAAVSLWSGDVGSAIKVLIENDALTADFVSFSAAAAGRGAWEAASRAFAFILEERGEPHLAVLHLTSIGDPAAACKVYTRAGMAREAASFAAAKLPPRHSLVFETRSVYASQLEGRGDFERAAAQYITSENWSKAIEMLQKRGTVGSLETALEILAIATSSIMVEKEGGDGRFWSVEEAEKLKLTLQNRLSVLQRENSNINGGIISTNAVEKKLSGLSLSSSEILKTTTPGSRLGARGNNTSQRQRYSNETLEQIKLRMANKEDALNEQFQKQVSTQFPDVAALLKNN
jgi:WD40 repeat protein